MKKLLTFELIGFASLNGILHVGIAGYAVDGPKGGRLRALYLFLVDGTVLTIQSKVSTVAPWHEVGTLVFQHEDGFLPTMIPLAQTWSSIGSVEKMLLEGDEFAAESGLTIHSEAGEEIVIVSGAFPHTVEIVAPFYTGDFQPEYEIGEYKHIPI